MMDSSAGGLPAIISTTRPMSASVLNSGSIVGGGDRDRRVRFVPSAFQGGRDGGLVDIRPLSPTCLRRHPTDPLLDQTNQVQDQIRQYREEIAKKDRYINQLTSTNGTRLRGLYDFGKVDDAFAFTDNLSMYGSRSDAALRLRVDTLQNQVRELQAQLEAREDKVRELKILNETARESEDRNAVIVQQLRSQLMRYQSEFGNLEEVASRSGIAISSLQEDSREAHQRIFELESRLRTHLDDREKAEQDRNLAEKNLSDLTTELCRVLFVEYSVGLGPLSTDEIIQRAQEMGQENALLKGKFETMKDFASRVELEQQTNRETIMRLMGEAEREQKSISRYTIDMENLVVERDAAMLKQEDLQKEIEILKERLEASQRAWSSMRKELEDQRLQQHQDFDRTLINQSIEGQHKAFKECLASLLSDGFVVVEPYEEVIRERVQNLVLGIRDKNGQTETLENKLSNMAAQLESQYELNRSSERKMKRAEADLLEMEDRLRRAENSLSTEDALRDGCRISQDRFIQSLERVGRAMNMPPFAIDMSLEDVLEAIVIRADQLGSNSVDSDRRVHVYNLQRKVKSLKEQLENKESHLEMYRQKLATLEDKVLLKSDVEREDEFAKNRKLVKLIEKYKIELNEAHLEIHDLKARLLQASDVQMQAMAKEGDVESRIQQLEVIRQKQENTIASLKEALMNQDQNQAAVQAISGELQSTKMALNELKKHHMQVLDLRRVMARMLGLNIESIAVPDFEMISRLEKLILANQANQSSSLVFDSSIEDMVEEFRQGYHEAERIIDKPQRSRSQRPTVKIGSRSRSLSPLKKKDPKVY